MIEELEEKDISKCLDIYNYYIENSISTFECTPLSIEEFKIRIKRIKKKFPFIIYKVNDEVLGYAYLDYFIEREAAFISADLSIYVKNDCHHMKIGSKLLNEIISLAPRYGIKNIISVVTTKNDASIRFHLNHNFIRKGTIDNIASKFGKSLGVIYFKLSL